MQCCLSLGGLGGLHWCGEPKRLETEASTGQQPNSLNLSSPFDLNFPLPGEKGPACLVKVQPFPVLSTDATTSNEALEKPQRVCRLCCPLEALEGWRGDTIWFVVSFPSSNSERLPAFLDLWLLHL